MENLHVKNRGKSPLDKEFNSLLRGKLNLSEEQEEIYNFILNQLEKNQMYVYLGELKYRMTDGENANEVLWDIVNKNEKTKTIFWPIMRRIQDYLDEDLYSKFYH